MLNIYLVYVSSVEGDVEMLRNVYTSFNKATEELNKIIDQYIADKKITSFRVYDKDSFDIKRISRDVSIPVNTYCFEMGKSTALIYKKNLIEGWMRNGAKLDLVGKIGITGEINIPVDQKLLRLIQAIQEDPQEIEIPEAPPGPTDEYKPTKASPSNYEHGQHVSFIRELKETIDLRNRLRNRFIPIVPEIPQNTVNNTANNFIKDLQTRKENLRSVPEINDQYIIDREVINKTIESEVTKRREAINDYLDDLSEDDISENDLLTTDEEWEDDTIDALDTIINQLYPSLPPIPLIPCGYGSPSSYGVQSPSTVSAQNDEIDKMVDEIMTMINLPTK